ncbi:MAG: tetratricopeptide repeat protein [Promethearchaeota archaeon]
MSESKIKNRPEELIQAEQLINDAKIHEAQALLTNYERKKGLTLHDRVSCHLLQCDLLFHQGRYKEILILAEQTYKECSENRYILHSVDCLIFMARSFIYLYKINKALDVITQGEELLKSVSCELSTEIMKREAFIIFLKGLVFERKTEGKLCLKYLKQSLELVEKTDFKRLNAIILRVLGWCILRFKGDMEQAFEYVKQGVNIAKDSKNKFIIAQCLLNLGLLYQYKGDWEKSLKILKECLSTYEEYENKERISNALHDIGFFYTERGEIDRSLEFLEQSLRLNRELGINWKTANSLIDITINLIKNHDLEKANQYLYDLEQMKICSKDKNINLWYKFCKALLLKTSLRAPSRGEAEIILKQIIDEKFGNYELNYNVLLNLCELLLTEARMLNSLEVLEELDSLVAQLLDLAEKCNSYPHLAETYFLKGKMALLTLDVKEARKNLTQAQRIAERWGYNQLATKISLEHEKLSNQIRLWDDLSEKEISLSERINLAGMEKQMEHLLHNRVSLNIQVTEDQITVHKERKICIVCKGAISGFMFSCTCNAIYCENCARALTDLENACWVCGAPIDMSKPIKPYVKEEIGEKVKIKKPKKSK